MDWNDLHLSADSLAKVRGEFAIETPEEVVDLAWGAEALLSRILSADEVAEIRKCNPKPQPSFTSSRFSRGARLGAPPLAANIDLDFVQKRDALVAKLDNAASQGQREALERQLRDLYSHSR